MSTQGFQVHTSYVPSLPNGIVQHVTGDNLHINTVNNLDNGTRSSSVHNILQNTPSHEQIILQQQQQHGQLNQRQNSPEDVLKVGINR